MSQWGSQGAALQGLTGSAILGFYYPSTVTTTIADAPIRVRLSDDGLDTAVRAQAGLAVRDVTSSLLYPLPAGPARWRALHDATGMHLEHGDGTTWPRWTAPDGRSTWAGPLRFGAGTTAVLTLYIGSAPTAYRGALTALPTGTNTVATVNTLAMDLYLRSVVPAESPAYWLAAALRAQAVAARTYAAYGRARSAGADWDTCDTTACQVYKGTVSEAASTTKAVQDTANQIRNAVRPADPRRVLRVERWLDGGRGGAVPGGQAGPVRRRRRHQSGGQLDRPLTAAGLRARYPQLGNPTALRVVARTGNGTWGGRITDLCVDGTAGTLRLPGEAPRVGLRSAWWIPAPTSSGPALVPAGSTVTLRAPRGPARRSRSGSTVATCRATPSADARRGRGRPVDDHLRRGRRPPLLRGRVRAAERHRADPDPALSAFAACGVRRVSRGKRSLCW